MDLALLGQEVGIRTLGRADTATSCIRYHHTAAFPETPAEAHGDHINVITPVAIFIQWSLLPRLISTELMCLYTLTRQQPRLQSRLSVCILVNSRIMWGLCFLSANFGHLIGGLFLTGVNFLHVLLNKTNGEGVRKQ